MLILRALYDVISGPAGERDWNRLRSLCVPEARFTSTTKTASSSAPRLLTIDDYIQRAGRRTTHGFYESAIVNRVQRFGNITPLFSSSIPQRSERKALRPRHQQHSALLRRPALVGPQHPVGRRIFRQSITFRNGHQAIRPGVRVTTYLLSGARAHFTFVAARKS